MINPSTLPYAKNITVINTNNGNTGIIDSIIIKKHASTGPHIEELLTELIINSYAIKNISFI